jgi:hypothetical protein
MSRSPLLAILAAAVATALAGAAAGPAVGAAPIPEQPADRAGLTVFEGRSAKPKPVSAPRIPSQPFMAPNGASNIHNDGYMSDTYRWSGPLGRDPEVLSARYLDAAIGLCGGTIGFDRRGRVVTVCISSDFRVRLRLLDPDTLDPLASFELPERVVPPGVSPFQSFTGGGYFYVNESNRAVIPTSTGHVVVVALRGGDDAPRWSLVRDYDVSDVVGPGDAIGSVLPDWRGRLWFVTRREGVVGVISSLTGKTRTLALGEAIGNSFAVDESGGVYIASDAAMYRFDLRKGRPKVTWRERYRNVGVIKPGQVDAGTGTTPTVMGRKYVSITDNADPMNVVVYRRARAVRGERLVCEQRVFRKGAGATENSLIGTDRSLIVENNFGYTGPNATSGARTTKPGVARVDVDRDGQGCRKVWTSKERVPSVVPKLSLTNGLIYAYTRPPGPTEAWYLSAISFRTGRTVFRQLVGTGTSFNNNYAGIAISPAGTLYLGVLGGTIRVRDRG